MGVIDATILLLMLRPGTPVPNDANGVPIDRPKERIDFLVQRLNNAKSKLIIPTPALSEALVHAGAEASQKIVEQLQKFSVFRIEPFDTRAALELAAMSREAISRGNKRGDARGTWAKVKFDRQIVAIAKVNGATTIYSDDADLKAIGKRAKIEVISLADLPLPPNKAQLELDYAADNPIAEVADNEDEAPSA